MKTPPSTYRLLQGLTLALSLFLLQVSACSDTKPPPSAPIVPAEILPEFGKFVAVEIPPKYIEKVKPVYPEAAREQCLEAVVFVSILVDKTGAVRDVKIVKSSGLNVGFEQAALDAARRSKFSPAIQNGKPIAVWATYDFRFRLPENNDVCDQ